MPDAYSSHFIQTDNSQCQCPAVAATHYLNLLQNDTNFLSRTRETNYSALSTKRSFISSLRWPALLCVFDSVPA